MLDEDDEEGAEASDSWRTRLPPARTLNGTGRILGPTKEISRDQKRDINIQGYC